MAKSWAEGRDEEPPPPPPPAPEEGFVARLYEYERSEDVEVWRPKDPVSDSLSTLIESGRRYPPALAIARRCVEREFPGAAPTKEAFLESYRTALEAALTNASSDRFILARSRDEQIGYTEKGGWYWIVGIANGGAAVEWISDDYHVYRDPIREFEISIDDAASLSERPAPAADMSKALSQSSETGDG